MIRSAKACTIASLALLPVVFYFAWPRAALLVGSALIAAPFVGALASFAWPRSSALRWTGFLLNAAYAGIMLGAFVRMFANVRPPPNFIETVPVILAVFVLLVSPSLNCIVLFPMRLRLPAWR